MKSTRKKQLSVFLENRVGALADLCRLISARSINLLAICAIDTVEEAVLRIVAEDGTAARDALTQAGFQVLETEVLLVELENTPGATGRLAATLAEAGVNIDYLYASVPPSSKSANLVLRTHQLAEAERILRAGHAA